jgi:hypothetical protein
VRDIRFQYFQLAIYFGDQKVILVFASRSSNVGPTRDIGVTQLDGLEISLRIRRRIDAEFPVLKTRFVGRLKVNHDSIAVLKGRPYWRRVVRQLMKRSRNQFQ